MSRAAPLLLALAFALAGCPLPQPLTDVPRTGATTTPPPRILTSSISPLDTVIPVTRGCPGGASASTWYGRAFSGSGA